MLNPPVPPAGRRWQGVLLALGVLVVGVSTVAEADSAVKIRFDVMILDEAGLYGPPDGLRALSYEFCIPDRAQTLAEVRAIDRSVRVQRARGRVSCVHGELLAIGDTHQPDHRAVLEALARLPYVARIEQAFFE